ncbi:cobalamin biosynthesis protein CobQ [Leptospira tipperaryensis]|uniref:Cobyric acid synthase n=1 Tax=Leptospira tipperaryensis TaxID=2564040 RepID=A0A1D7V3X5_9LEPT|nr:cobyric acid synthase [Leptospira tipperaryensis]AOP36540.1 cobalamin biosynthesis protein CobQ [Leptospira tipperaryensis]
MRHSKHGGNLRELGEKVGCLPEEILDFSANINPMGFPEWLRPTILSKISEIVSYPDPNYASLKNKIHSVYGIYPEQIALGNGASELIRQIPFVAEFDFAVIQIPSYGEYSEAVGIAGLPVHEILLNEEEFFRLDTNSIRTILNKNPQKKGLVFLGHPNNPTGVSLIPEEIVSLTAEFPNSIFVIDESFIDFCKEGTSFRNQRPKNVILIWSLTKILAIPGLRMGVCFASSEIIAPLSRRLPMWNVNTIAASVFEKAIDDKEYFQNARDNVTVWREDFSLWLSNLGFLQVFPSDANFLLLKIINDKNADFLSEFLLTKHKIAVRNCGNFRGLSDRFIRVAVRTREENKRLIEALEELNLKKKRIPKIVRKTPALMFQGTASNVGKSILTSALCRILVQDGFKVAPFKSQNMALNSFVTPEGGEIGRAQALQAQAAKILPDIRMNPILLKPSSEKDSQVVINGKPIAAMDFRDYSKYKTTAFAEVKKAYDSLSSEYDVILIEGAGSASEVNLKKNDIVNMRMAQYAAANVLLVGNIDHGGLFGSILGTMETLAEWERKLVSGFIINRFRGIKELLKTGTTYLEEYAGKPVLGIVSHLQNIDLPEEDSLEFKSGALDDHSPLGDRIDIALIDTPRISNHTDIDALRLEPDVRVRIVRSLTDLGDPDVILLPGSKNVITDLEHLHNVGLAKKIQELAKQEKTEIVGICGGYQILGKTISDPHQIETDRGSAEGLGLLQIVTVLEKYKSLRQITAIHLPTGTKVSGYEIHHGKSTVLEQTPGLFSKETTDSLGHSHKNERIWGTYIHGIFDEDEFRRKFIDKIRIRKGKNALVEIQTNYNLEKSLDKLADHVRNSLDLQRIYKILGIA